MTFLSPGNWPRATRFGGLAYGWHGFAWVWLHLVRAGLVPDRAASRRQILRRLEGDPGSAAPYVSALVGCAAGPLVAALGSTVDPAFAPIFRRQLGAWRRRCLAREAHVDVMWGTAGGLLAACEIERHREGSVDRELVATLHERSCERLRRLLAGGGALLGLSHGLAGYLLALEMAQLTFGRRLPGALGERCVDAIAREGFHASGAAAWPKVAGEGEIGWHSWCHGGPGIGLAFLCAHRASGRPAYRELARLALRGAHRFSTDGTTTFCCGSVGRAQILVEAYRQTGEARWLAEARALSRGIRFVPYRRRKNLWSGTLGHHWLGWRLRVPALPLPGLGALSA